MIAIERLVAWTLGEDDALDVQALDVHVLACADCARVATRLMELGDATAALTRGGLVAHAMTGALLAAMQAEGLDVRRYDVRPGETVACHATATQRYAVTRLEADLSDARRVDVTMTGAGAAQTASDAPFDPGGVWLASPGELVRGFPNGALSLSLTAIREGGARETWTYGLQHRALGE